MLHASVEDKPNRTNPSVYLLDVHRYLENKINAMMTLWCCQSLSLPSPAPLLAFDTVVHTLPDVLLYIYTSVPPPTGQFILEIFSCHYT